LDWLMDQVAQYLPAVIGNPWKGIR